jgi:hypothetical protein
MPGYTGAAPPGAVRRRPAVLLAAGAAVVAAVVTAWLLWPRPAVTVAQARSYLNVTACLLTGPGGIAPGTPGLPVWSAMQAASRPTHVMVSYLAVSRPADAPVMLSTLVQRQCGIIITAGIAPGPVLAAARISPRQRFLMVAATATSAAPPARAAPPANAAIVPPAAASGRIGQAIHALAAA